MEANPRTLLRVFQPDIQYVVPIFQRRYVWNEEDQWAELWEDLVELLDDVQRVEALIAAGADLPLPSHFLGAIVCDQSLSTGSDIDERPLIDGQQRLTTLQLLLGTALRLSRTYEVETAIGLLSKLVENDETLVERLHHTFKLWPSDPDRKAFEAVMTGAVWTDETQLVAAASTFFERQITDWIGDDDAAPKLTHLARTLRKHVELVVIDLQAGDNAQVIFESLNYGGRELTAIDLTKNHVFFQATKLGLDLHEIHKQQWAPFDEDWWRTEVRQGRLTRARAELLLMHWLKLEKLEEVRAHRLFVEFRDLPAVKSDLAGTVARLAADRDLYRQCEENPASLTTPTGGFFPRLDLLDQSTPRPVALQLLRAVPQTLTSERASRALHALDSYMWRRALTRGTTANYNRLMLDLLKAINEDIEHADDRLIEHLAGLNGNAVRWPTDDELRQDLGVRVLYGGGRVKGATISTALRLIENEWRRPRGESPLRADNSLQIEHMLPQEWGTYWPVDPDPADTLAEREQARESHLHRLGNLTLVSPGMNSSLSNREWNVKRDGLREHSNVLITQRYLDKPWDESAIRDRANALIETLTSIWPGPTGAFVTPAQH
ncbi:MAG: DUF262 domain-containing protein [Actinomycetota bacterium]|nr:DUF262 domain-containing protein [Actinomycetota bacterium]